MAFMQFFRAFVSAALAAYVIVVPPFGLNALAQVWAWYATADAVAAFIAVVPLSPRDGRFAAFLFQALWSIGGAIAAFLMPDWLLLTLFVMLPLWSIGSSVLTLSAIQQIRGVIELRWLIAIGAFATATFAYVIFATAAGNTTWVRGVLAASAAVNTAGFLLTALGRKEVGESYTAG
jgi:hypothetical protein